ncbi:hypothetical protein B0J17DRAFT_621322 [Rhizoctonia solani]|nr:hypothetical protein B0J17DRAFT_621322 [Rhizoctonia solani]
MSVYTFSTNDEHTRQESVPHAENSRTFETHFPAEDIPLGLNLIDIKHGTDYRVRSYIDGIEPVDKKYEAFKATVHIDTWHETALLAAGCTWLDVSKWDRQFQFGRLSTTGKLAGDNDKVIDIKFERPYDEIPNVVAWLYTVNIDRKQDSRIHAHAVDVTTTGFKLRVYTWDETVVYDAKASWVAVPPNWPNVVAGSSGVSCLPTEPLPGYKKQIKFGKPFQRPPRVLVALNKFHTSNKHDLRIEAMAENITPKGMTLTIKTWGDSVLYEAGVDYIAIAD